VRSGLILAARQCLRRAWLERRPSAPSAAQRSASRNSRVVRELAQDLFEEPLQVPMFDSLVATQRLLERGQPLLDASFQHGGVDVRADALVPGEEGWVLHRFRPATRSRSWHLDELALQIGVIQGSGLPLSQAWLHRLDRRYRRGAELNARRALRSVEHLSELQGRALPELPELPEDEPDIAIGDHCRRPRRCPFLAHCSPELSPFDLSRIPRGGHLHKEARELGLDDWRQLPGPLSLSRLQARMLEALRRGEALLEPSVLPALRPGEPCHFLDFEAYAPALPPYEGMRPYDALLVQFSVHSTSPDGLRHQALLIERGDPREVLATALIEALREPGPVFVYGEFEGRALGTLAAELPELAAGLQGIRERLVDLLPLVQEGCVHPDFGAGFGLKRVLPVLCPEEGYEDLDLVGGDVAAASYGELVDPETPGYRREQLREGLLAYCARDTLALARVREALIDLLSQVES
jgi:hypothetical protein